jgi:hypothetical protein
MHPLYNYAYDDDFAYAKSVQMLYETGEFHLTEWTAPTLVAQVWWGVIFTKFFGFSFVSLHFSVAVLLFISLVAFYRLLCEFKVEEFTAMIFTLFLLAFPWVTLYTFTFMTDVPFMSFTILSLYFYSLAIWRKWNHYLMIGGFMSSLAFLVRQSGLLLPISIVVAVTITNLIKGGVSKRQIFTNIILVVFFPILTLGGYILWLSSTGQTYSQWMVSGAVKHQLQILLFGLFSWAEMQKTSLAYADLLHKLGFYLVNVTPFLLIGLVMFRIPFKIGRQISVSGRILLVSLFVFVILLGVVVLPPHSAVKLPQISNIYFPDKIFFALSTFFPDQMSAFKIVWDRLVFVSLLVFSVVLVASGKVVFDKFLLWQPRIRHWKLLCLILFIGITFLFYQQIAVMSLHSTVIAAVGLSWLIYLLISSLLMSPVILTGIRLKKGASNYTINFAVVLNLILLLFATVLLPTRWAEYSITYIPFFIIIMAWFSRIISLDKGRAVVIIFVLVLYSLVNTKTTHFINGNIWQTGEQLVAEGVNPALVGTGQFAWYPWWKYEQLFREKPYQIKNQPFDPNQSFTFWGFPSRAELKYRIIFSNTHCSNKVLAEKEVTSIPVSGFICTEEINK